MSEEIEYIEHDGRVISVDVANKKLTVSITDEAECGACPAGKLCNNFSPDKNVVDIHVPNPEEYTKGDFVTIRGAERLHRKAIMLVTVIPSLALIAAMIGVYLLTWSQLAACLSGLGAMIFFFIILYLMRHKLAHEFNFEVFLKPSEPAVKAEQSPSDKNKQE